MSTHPRLFVYLLAIPMVAIAADHVVLKNGDKLTGAVVKKDGDKLVFKSEFLGEVTMPWSAVTSLTSDETLTVVLPGGETVKGKVETAGPNIQVAAPAGPKSAPLTAVGDIRNPAEQQTWERLQHPRITELWTGFFDLGFALARGNARTDNLTTGFNATRVTRHDKIMLRFNQIYGSSRVNNVSSVTANAVRGGWLYNRDITPRFFVAAFNDYEYDEFQSLDLRAVFGGGFGVNVIKHPNTSLSISGGADYSHEKFFALSRNSAEVNIGDEFLHKFSSSSSFTQTFRFFPNMTNTGEYRINFDVGEVTAIKKWLSWNLTASDRYLSNPVFGRQRNDLIVSTGFRVSFGSGK